MIHHLFPVPLKSSYLTRPFTVDEVEFFHNQSLERVHNNHNQLNKNHYVLHEPQMQDLLAFIEGEVKTFVEETYNHPEEIKIYVTQSWINYTNTGERHHRHAHPNSIYSGVFYIAANRNYDSLTVYRDDGYQRISIQSQPTEHFRPSVTFPVETGQLLIFPSNLIHEVKTAGGIEERVSLAFNTFVSGKLSPGGQKLTELKLV